MTHLLTNKPFKLDTNLFDWLSSVTYSIIIKYCALVRLTNLQKLKFRLRSKEEVTIVLKSPIITSGQLLCLDLQIITKEAIFPSLKTLSQCRFLDKLRLKGPIEEDLHDSSLPTSLVKLTLESSRILRDPMVVLEKLPNLRILWLISHAYDGSKMACSVGGFPKLETLELRGLTNLEEWLVEKGAMPSLKKLTIGGIPKLKMIPEGLKFVTTLQQLNVADMKSKFKYRLRPKEDGTEGKDFYEVRHISSIVFGKF